MSTRTVPRPDALPPDASPSTRLSQAENYVETAFADVRTPEKIAFLVGLRLRGSVSHAAEYVGIARQRMYEWRESDPVFARAWDTCLEDAIEKLEASVYERGIEGEGMPAVVASIAWLKTRRPEWNDKVQAARALAAAMQDNPALGLARVLADLLDRALPVPQTPKVIDGVAKALPDGPASSA